MFTPIKLLFLMILTTLFFYLLITYPPSFLIFFTTNINSFLYLANGLAMLASLAIVEAASTFLLGVFKREAPIENSEKLSVNNKKQVNYFSIENKSENDIGKTTHQPLTFFEKEKESHPSTLYGKELIPAVKTNNSVFCPLGFQ